MAECLRIDPSLVLRRHRVFASVDIDETRDRISRIMQPHRLTPRGQATPFRAHMDFVRLHRLGIGTIQFGAMEVEVPEVEDYHLLIFCLRGRGTAAMPGGDLPISDTRGVALNPGERLLARFSEDAEQFVVRIESGLLRRAGPPRRLCPSLDAARQEMGPFVRHLRMLATDPDLVAIARANRQVVQDYERLLVSLLDSGHPGPRRVARSIAPATVRRAEAYIEAHSHEPLTLGDIARAAGVPERTLQEGFRRFRGVSPIAALRTVRLNAARRRLLSGAAERGVSALAMECGFAHLSRFAAAYHGQFGEWPSQTLANGSGRAARRA